MFHVGDIIRIIGSDAREGAFVEFNAIVIEPPDGLSMSINDTYIWVLGANDRYLKGSYKTKYMILEYEAERIEKCSTLVR